MCAGAGNASMANSALITSNTSRSLGTSLLVTKLPHRNTRVSCPVDFARTQRRCNCSPNHCRRAEGVANRARTSSCVARWIPSGKFPSLLNAGSMAYAVSAMVSSRVSVQRVLRSAALYTTTPDSHSAFGTLAPDGHRHITGRRRAGWYPCDPPARLRVADRPGASAPVALRPAAPRGRAAPLP